jgi:hypothetical protein
VPNSFDFGLHDRDWTEDEWHQLIQRLVETGLISWEEVTSLVLGQLNPSQVGTSLASSEGFKRRYGKGNTMRVVIDWFYQQAGICADCGTRLDLQADHDKPREDFPDPLDADFIENLVLRCRRHNVIRRPSHQLGGTTYLTAESALMWILFVIRPRTFFDFLRLCRLYGMTMADVRMQEAWAMAHWLSRLDPPAYHIEEDSAGCYDLLCWPDNAITRRSAGESTDGDPDPLYCNVRGTDFLGFVTGTGEGNFKFHQISVQDIPFSTYDLGSRSRSDLALIYIPPNRQTNEPPRLLPLPPRNHNLLVHAVREPTQGFRLTFVNGSGSKHIDYIDEKPDVKGQKIKCRNIDPSSFHLEVF